MKRLVGIAIVIILLAGSIAFPTAAQESAVRVEVNGNSLEFDQPPVIENGRTLVPFRAIFEALSMTVDYKEENGRQIVTAQQGEKNIRLIIGADEFYLNETPVPLDVPAKIINSRTLIPVRAIAESLDANVDWDDETRTVLITTDGTRLIKSRNLVNPSALSVGYVSKQTGEVIGTADTWRTSDYLPVQPGEVLASTNREAECITLLFLAAYDSNKKVIPSVGLTRGDAENGKTYVVPEGVSFVRVSVGTQQAADVDDGGWMIAVEKDGYFIGFEEWFAPYSGMPKEESAVKLQHSETLFAMPRIIYVFSGEPLDIFLDEILPEYHSVQVESPSAAVAVKYLSEQRKLTITATEDADGIRLLAIGKNGESLGEHSFSVRVATKGTQKSNATIHAIGDSFTDINHQYKWISDNCRGLEFVGILYSLVSELRHDGRTGTSLGWMVNTYRSSLSESGANVSEFVHPESNEYRYYGGVGYWQYIMHSGKDGSVSPRFEKIAKELSIGTDGKRKNPLVGDLMYDGARKTFIVWNGSSWQDISAQEVGKFDFRYDRYLEVYQIDVPDIICVQMGTNDYFNYDRSYGMEHKNATFLYNLQTFVRGLQEALPEAKIILVLPPKGTMNESNDKRDYAQGNQNMMDCRKTMIQFFDEYKGENVYLVDGGATIDPYQDFGVIGEYESDFTRYPEEVWGLVKDGIHVNGDGFQKIGQAIGACIEYIR